MFVFLFFSFTLYSLSSSAGFPDNPFELKPSYKFWSPYIGPFSRKDQAYNSEHRKCHHEKDLEDFGCRRPTLDEVADLLEGGTVSENFLYISTLINFY